jgi:hypothetical protein
VRLRTAIAGLALAVLIPASAAAQDFGVMNSAETINRGNFKLMGNPIVLFGRDGGDGDTGIGVSGGYGFTDRFDVEGKLAFFDDITFVGVDAEYWLVQNEPVDVSVIGGFHVGNADLGFDTRGLDVTFLASGEIAPRLELYGALDFAVNSYNEDFIDDDFTTAHLVPGIEYRVSPDIDLVAEFGIGLNDNSRHYVSGGIAFYLR